MDESAISRMYGRATVGPLEDVVAASYGTRRLTYTAGDRGVPTGGRIRIYTDSDTDWGLPQFHDPAGSDYMTFEVPSGVRATGLVRNLKTLLLTVTGRDLKAGERIVVVYGDRSGGGPGSRAQTFVEARRYFRVSVDLEGDGNFVQLPNPPYVSVVGGPAARLVVTAQSVVSPGRPFRLGIKAEDAWGNPSHLYRGIVRLEADGLDLPVAEYAFQAENGGVRSFEGCVCRKAGLFRIQVSDAGSGLVGQSNPIVCVEEQESHSLYWGELHGGQVELAAKIPDFFRYARDVSNLDFVGYQRNDHDMSSRDWERQQQEEVRSYQPGRFVPVPGFEWSGDTEMGGDHNVYFRRHGQALRRSSHSGVGDRSDEGTDLPHILDVYKNYHGSDVVITPHVGGRHSDLSFHDPGLEPAIEVTSTHGTFEWFLQEALQRGHRVGFLGGSDGYTGRPGGEYPGHQERRYAKGGYTALYARELTIEGLLEALKARRCYATTGVRILARVSVDGHLMGEEYSTSASPRAEVFVAGTAPLESVELFRGLERIYRHPVERPHPATRVCILWEGASRKTSYSGVIWDGSLGVIGGKIKSLEKLRFDSPRSYVTGVMEGHLRWHSVACGYRSGIILDLDGGDRAELELVVRTTLISGPKYGGDAFLGSMRISYRPAEEVRFSVSLAELARGPKVVDIGPLERKVSVALAPERGGPDTARFSFVDSSPQPGINPYWVRVVQSDMEMAWTSPVFVDYAGT